MRKFLRRWADVSLSNENASLRRQVAELSSQLDDFQRRLAVATAEAEALAAVIARDRMRVAAETAEFAARRANAEGSNYDNGPRQSVR